MPVCLSEPNGFFPFRCDARDKRDNPPFIYGQPTTQDPGAPSTYDTRELVYESCPEFRELRPTIHARLWRQTLCLGPNFWAAQPPAFWLTGRKNAFWDLTG